ncbi:MAG: HEAT repeat domain-containing protein, partial [Gemmatimonadaceae bacterium]
IQKVLARRDECSVQLRRSAVFLLASKRRDAAAISQLTQVARTDPSPEVRSAAIEWMSRIPGDEIVATLEDLAKSSDDERIQRAAVRGLMMNPTARARAAVRTLIERNETPDRLRAEALGAFSGERATNEDVAWLRTLYGKSDSPRMQARIVAAVSRVGGAEVDQWLMTIARNADEDSEVRGIALRRVSRTLAIPDLAKLYDQSADRSSREMLIGAMSDRAEPEATDKLIDIVKTGTDPQLRRSAIGALTRKKDPRTTRLLMEIVDR